MFYPGSDGASLHSTAFWKLGIFLASSIFLISHPPNCQIIYEFPVILAPKYIFHLHWSLEYIWYALCATNSSICYVYMQMLQAYTHIYTHSYTWMPKFLTYLEAPYAGIIDTKMEAQEESVCDRNTEVFIKEFFGVCACSLSHSSRVRLCSPIDCSPARLLCPWDSPGKNTGVGFLWGLELFSSKLIFYFPHCCTVFTSLF